MEYSQHGVGGHGQGDAGGLVINRPARKTGALLLVLLLAAFGCAAPSDGHIGGTVRVVGSWSGPEEEAFKAMVRPFEQRTGVTVLYTGTRDLNGVLWQGVATGKPPDVAGLPGPGQMAEFAQLGALKDLGGVIDVAQ